MDAREVDELVKIFRGAKVSELSVTAGDSTVRLRKSLHAAPPRAPAKARATAPKPEPEIVETAAPESWITAPMVGVFHGSDKAMAAGSRVKAGQVVGAIESMKLMNEVVSEYDGVIVEIAVEDLMAVEYGHKLFRVDAA